MPTLRVVNSTHYIRLTLASAPESHVRPPLVGEMIYMHQIILSQVFIRITRIGAAPASPIQSSYSILYLNSVPAYPSTMISIVV
jgi:hypothetical protein